MNSSTSCPIFRWVCIFLSSALSTGQTSQARGDEAVRAVVIAPLHVATGKADDAHVGELVADVLTVALSGQSKLAVVERRRLDDVLREQKLTLSGLVEPATAIRVGKLLTAQLVVAGSVLETEGKLHYVVYLVAVEGGEVLGTVRADGARGAYEQSMSKIAREVTVIAGGSLPDVDPADLDDSPVGRLHLMRGIGFYHGNNPDQAIVHCLRAVHLDPRLQEARLWIARSYLRAGEPRHARVELEQLAKNPSAKRFSADIAKLLIACDASAAAEKSKTGDRP